MSFEQYVQEVQRTVGDDTPTRRKIHFVFGLAEEVGEVVGWHKKTMFQKRLLHSDELVEELGDALWYFVALCKAHGISLGEVMEMNIAKLRKRYPEGFVTGGGNR